MSKVSVSKTKKSAVNGSKNAVNSLTAKKFIDAVKSHQSDTELKNNSRFYNDTEGGKCLGVRMKTLFDTAKQFTELPLNEFDTLFDNPYYEVRMGAVCIMDFRARRKNISPDEKEFLFKLYMRRHDRINNWDFVDRGAPSIVGGYLLDKPRAALYKLAKSKNIWERRTAIVSTYAFIKQNDINETFKIAEMLVHDKEDLIHKAVGSWIREAGKRDRQMLIAFLDKYVSIMPRTMLRYATEKLDKQTRDAYMEK